MKNKIIGICLCMLMIIAMVVPIAMTSEKSNLKPLVATAVPVAGNSDQSSVEPEGCDCNSNYTIAWEQLPDINETGIDIRVDRNDKIPRMIVEVS